MSPVRIALVGMVGVAAMFVAIRRAPVEPQKADAAISIEALRDVGLMRAAAVVTVPKAEKPMVLPPLEPIPPKIDQPARPAPPPPKAAPAPQPTMMARRARPRIERDLCARHGFRTVHYGRWRWRCER